MRKALSIVAAGATLMVGVVSATAAKAGRAPLASPLIVATPCAAGTWVQTPANVTSAMVNGTLYADTIVSSTDAWAVGEYYNNNTSEGSLWENWTGGSRWNVISRGAVAVQLDAVTNFGADNVWAAGYLRQGTTGLDMAVISSWNGVKVIRAKLPTKGTFSELGSISGSSESDIWASGIWHDPNDGEDILLYHYNGSAWSLAPAPPVESSSAEIMDLSPTNVFMVVQLLHRGQVVDVYHYNGVAWSVDLTNVPIDYYYGQFAGSSGSDLYANDTTDEGVDHWNGQRWSHVGTFNTDDTVYGVAEGPVGTVWSDGKFTPSSGREIYVAGNGVRQTNPSAVMTQSGIMNGVASGSGLVIAVGGQEDDTLPQTEPIVVMSCN